MANLFAQNTANWDAANQWNTVANGSGSYQTPGASDVCMANGKTVTVNISPTVSEVRTDTTGGATTGGGFTLSNGVTLTANVYAGSSSCVTFNGTVGNSASIVGNVVGGSSGSSYGANNSNTGTLNITGNAIGGSGANNYGVNNSSTGTLNVTGTGTGGSSAGAHGITNSVSGTVALTGSVVGGGNATSYGASNYSTGSMVISGNATGGTLGYGCHVNSTGPTTILGYAIANNYPNESLTAGTYGVYNNSASNAAVKVGGTKTGTGGYPAVYGRHFFAAGGVQAAYLYDGNAGSAVNLNGVAQSYPNAADVRYGTQYNANSQTGTCRIPAAASVLYGVLVDNTSGTATLAAADIRSALGLNSANLDTQLSTIAGYIDTEIGAIKAKTDNLPADTNTLLTSNGVKIASGAIAAATFAANALDAVWSASTRTLTSGGGGGGGATAQEVWQYTTRTLTSGGGGGGGATAQEIWEYISTLLPSGAEAMLAGIATRLAAQVATGPVVVVAAPGAGQTTAWIMCVGPTGAPEQGVSITITCTKTSDGGAFDSTPVVLTSDADGLAAGQIPRGSGRSFTAQRGSGKAVKFAGVDAATLALPPLLGAP